MDFKKLNTKAGAAKGAFLHLTHPALGHHLYTGEGADADGVLIEKSKAIAVGCHVVGLESERARERAKKIQRSKLKGDDEENGLDFICSLVVDFVGIEQDGKPMVATDENKRAFFMESDALAEQVLEFAKDRANFFKRA